LIKYILRDRVCDGMELSCSYENKYLRPEDNVKNILGDDIDDEDDIFKHKDIIMQVRSLLFNFCLSPFLIMKNTNLAATLPMDDVMLSSLRNMTAFKNFWVMKQPTLVFFILHFALAPFYTCY
jgi:hypothetical protein